MARSRAHVRSRAGEVFTSSSRRLPRSVIWSEPDVFAGASRPVMAQGALPGTAAVAVVPQRRFPAKQVLRKSAISQRLNNLAFVNELRFSAPSAVKACVRRHERREVLFAQRKAGFSGSAKKRHWLRSSSSNYKC